MVEKSVLIMKGILCNIEKVNLQDAQNIIDLRNNVKIRKFLSNKENIGLTSQINWQKKQLTRRNDFYYKIVDRKGHFKGTISLYNLDCGRAEFGRYICTNPLLAIDSELTLIKLGFEILGLDIIYCRTVLENKKVWEQHKKFGFKVKQIVKDDKLQLELVHQELTKLEYLNWNYESIKKTLKHFA